MKNTTISEIGNFDVSIQSALNNDGSSIASLNFDVLSDLQFTTVQLNAEGFITLQAQSFSTFAALELEGEDSHTDQVTSVDSFEALSNDSLDALEIRTLGSPISGRSRTVFLAGEDDGLLTILSVLVSSIEDIELLATGEVDSLWAGLFNKLVDDSDIGKSTSSHNFIITSSSTISVEIFRFDTSSDQISTSRRVLGDVTSGGDVISSDGITERSQAVSVLDVLDFRGVQAHSLEEGRIVDIGGAFLPLILDTFTSLETIPSVGTLGNLVVDFLEHFGLDGFLDNSLDFISRRPDVTEEDGLSIRTGSEGFSFEVDVDGTTEGIGNNEGRRSQIVGSGKRVDSTFEVSVTRKDGGSDQIALGDGFRNAGIEVTRVTDTGHATITGQGETEFIEILGDTSLFVVSGNDTRTGRQGGLDVRLNLKTLLDGISGHKTSSEHDVGVRSVGAGSDSSNNDITVSKFIFLIFVGESGFSIELVFRDTETLETNLVGEAGVPVLLHINKSDSIVRSLGARKTAVDGAEVEFQDFTAENGFRLRTVIKSEKVVGSEVSFNEGNLFRGSVGLLEVFDSLVISREVTHSGTVFGTHVGQSGSVSNAEGGSTGTKVFNEFTDDTSLSQHLSTSEDQISSSGGLGEFSSKLETDDFGKNHGDGLTEHDGFTFNTTDTPTNDTETVDHGSVRISTDDGIGIEDTVVFKDSSGEIFQVNLMADTGAGRDGQEVLEGGLTPLEEFESFVVSFEFNSFVSFSGISSLGNIDLNGVINNQIDGNQGVDLLGITSKSGHSVSHSSQIDNTGDTSEILQKNSSRLERNFDTFSAGLGPIKNLFNISGFDVEFITVSKGTFEEDSDGEGEFLDSGVLEVGEGVVVVGFSVDVKLFTDVVERVGRFHNRRS